MKKIQIKHVMSFHFSNFFFVMNNMVLVCDHLRYYRTNIYAYDYDSNLIEMTRYDNYFQIMFSPNQNKILIIYLSHNLEVIDNNTNISTNITMKINNGVKVNCNAIYWKNNHELIALQYNEILICIGVYDLNLSIIKSIDVGSYNLKWKGIKNSIGKISFVEDDIYLWDDSKILIIDKLYNITSITNNYQVEIYNKYHNMFFNNKLETYQIKNGSLVIHSISNDYWNDTFIPEYINNIIQILIEFELFPNEIINIVYQQVVNINTTCKLNMIVIK